jgi:ribosome maturation factor RimP
MREALLPSFYTTMTFKEKVANLLEEALQEKASLFLVDFSISESYKITVTLDGDNGVILQDCIDISRVIENNLEDRKSVV